MAERHISLEGLPDAMARTIEVMVQAARNLAASDRRKEMKHIELPVWNLGIKQPLRREDYYDDAD